MMEPYLHVLNNHKYRVALTRLRMNSHFLEIERGRHTNPITLKQCRLCPRCKVVEDEQHFVTSCKIYINERKKMMSKIIEYDLTFQDMPLSSLYVKLMKSEDSVILNALGKFIYNAFALRTDFKLSND